MKKYSINYTYTATGVERTKIFYAKSVSDAILKINRHEKSSKFITIRSIIEILENDTSLEGENATIHPLTRT